MKIFTVSILTLAFSLWANEPSYDWRNTTWWGGTIGNVTGTGLAVEHWGESMGYHLTGAFLTEGCNDESCDKAFSAGAMLLFSLKKPEAAPVGDWGFSTFHPHWFIASGSLGSYNYESSEGTNVDYMTFASVGVGVNLNRRDSRFSLRLGIGPYINYVRNAYDTEKAEPTFKIYPTFEFSWLFGAPRRIEK